MKRYVNPEPTVRPALIARPKTISSSVLKETVSSILQAVKEQGDEALKAYTLQFEGVSLDRFEREEEAFREAEKRLPEALKQTIQLAASHIRIFHQAQDIELPRIETAPGVMCWQKNVPIERVGLYVPGGTAPLFSTVLMLGIPATIAGCGLIELCTPPDKQGEVHPAILYAARLAGVHRVFKVGGAQAIAAMAYGTDSIPAVYKLFGPGNQYVTAAKQQVSQEGIAIDMPAGPSEVAVIADHTANPVFVAADLLSQAEHGADSQVLLITTDPQLADEVEQEVARQVQQLPRKDLALKSLENSRIIILADLEQVIRLANDYAPEHLILALEHSREVAEQIVFAGSVFVGYWTPESVGDYASGTNHTLPTGGHARAISGLNLDSFRKRITFQELTVEGLRQLGPVVARMAEAETLTAHRQAVECRMNRIKH
jgi:histidinol dehydrogenase